MIRTRLDLSGVVDAFDTALSQLVAWGKVVDVRFHRVILRRAVAILQGFALLHGARARVQRQSLARLSSPAVAFRVLIAEAMVQALNLEQLLGRLSRDRPHLLLADMSVEP